MNMQNLVWLEEYNIGVPIIDEAHEDFFRIVRRLHGISQRNPRWAGSEGVKFLKIYTLNHFQQEEEYMQSIGYKDLPLHIAQHDILRHKVAPKIEGHLAAHSYSLEAVEKFLHILVLWIRRHILVHDRAITWANASPASL